MYFTIYCGQLLPIKFTHMKLNVIPELLIIIFLVLWNLTGGAVWHIQIDTRVDTLYLWPASPLHTVWWDNSVYSQKSNSQIKPIWHAYWHLSNILHVYMVVNNAGCKVFFIKRATGWVLVRKPSFKLLLVELNTSRKCFTIKACVRS